VALHDWHVSLKSRPVIVVVIGVVYLILTMGQASLLQAQQSLQSYLNSLTARQHGSVIVINPSTGEICAVWNLRRATMDAYPPGSTGKIVEASAALEQGLLTPSDRIVCRRVPPLLGPDYRCVHPPAPQGFTVSSALANSCNYFFTVVSLRLDAQSLIHWYSVFGFGTPAELDGMATSPGQVRLAKRARAKALEAIGEWGVVVTPAQLLDAYALVANRGTIWPLRTKNARRRHSGPFRQITLKRSTYKTILNGLVGCVRLGTCHAAAVPGVQVAGKTGTASALDGSRATHAWFVGFAPAERPEVALVVFLDRGTGEHTAAPLAGDLFRQYFATRRKGGESNGRH
jgi:cell division protein FtsI/penicillin-binding protein 2